MNDDEPLSDLADVEARLRAWRPADLPPGLHARLRSAGPQATRRLPARSVPPRAGALAWTLAAAACVVSIAVRFAAPSGPVDKPARGETPIVHSLPTPERFAGTRWTPGERLTMNLATGVPPGVMPVAWRLDGGPAALSDLILVRSANGTLPLKVDCEF